MEFSENIVKFLDKEFNHITHEDINNMSLEELLKLKEMVIQKRQEYFLIEMAYKTCANAAYGACGNEHFYWYHPDLAADITAECRQLTKHMWTMIPKFLHEDIWNRKDLWELCDFKLDESKKEWYQTQIISHQSDTDSTYATYEGFFECMTPEYQEKYATDEAKVKWILDFYKKFMDKQQKQWSDELFNPRHGQSVHKFELELICKSTIGLAKKKYVKGVAFEKGHFMIDHPKLKSTGVEIVKSTTPPFCRKLMKEIVDDLLYQYDPKHKDEWIYEFNAKLLQKYNEFKQAPIDDISQSVGIGDYNKYVINDSETLELGLRCPFSVKAAARYNYLAKKNGRADLVMKAGKIKYYNIRISPKETDYFGFPSGECPDFAPPVDYTTQWEKNLIDPINRFLEAMNIPSIAPTGVIQKTLFGW